MSRERGETTPAPRTLTLEEFKRDKKITLSQLPPGSVIYGISNGDELDSAFARLLNLFVRSNMPDEPVERAIIFNVGNLKKESPKILSTQLTVKAQNAGFYNGLDNWRMQILPHQMPPSATLTKAEVSSSNFLTVLGQVDRYSTGRVYIDTVGIKAFAAHLPECHATGVAVLVSTRAIKSQRIKRPGLDYYKVLYDPNSY